MYCIMVYRCFWYIWDHMGRKRRESEADIGVRHPTLSRQSQSCSLTCSVYVQTKYRLSSYNNVIYLAKYKVPCCHFSSWSWMHDECHRSAKNTCFLPITCMMMVVAQPIWPRQKYLQSNNKNKQSPNTILVSEIFRDDTRHTRRRE